MVQPTLQQIEQAMDITMEPAGKMLTCKVSMAVRLQAAARGLLAHRRLQVGMKTDRIRTNITDIVFVFIFMSGFGFEYG
jgi:hypothetical protein